MGLEDVIRAIVPLSFLAIWLLTSIFNRDAKPLPPRQGFGGPIGAAPPRPLQEPVVGRDVSMRWGPGSQSQESGFETPVRRSPAEIREEDILVIRAEQPRPLMKVNPAQRRTRSKPAPAKKAASIEAELLGGALGSNVSQQMKPIDLTRTNTPFTAVGDLSNKSHAAEVAYGPRSQGLTDVRITLMDPARIREAFILNEILQPPVSRRFGRLPR